MALDGPFTANMCVIIMPFGSTGCGFGAVPGTISQIFCQKPGRLVSYTSLRSKMSLFESSKQWNGHRSGFCLRLNGRVIEGLTFHSASWPWSTVQPSIHSCPGELEQTLTTQLPKHRDILKAADSEKQTSTLMLKTESRRSPYRVKKV